MLAIYPFLLVVGISTVVFVHVPAVPLAVYDRFVVYVVVSSAFYIYCVVGEYVVVVWIGPDRVFTVYVPAVPVRPDAIFYLCISSVGIF